MEWAPLARAYPSVIKMTFAHLQTATGIKMMAHVLVLVVVCHIHMITIVCGTQGGQHEPKSVSKGSSELRILGARTLRFGT